MTEAIQTSKHSFRFHVLSLPHTVTTPEYNACAYTMKVLKFCKMMRSRGHYIIHYGHKDSVVDTDEHVTLLDNDDLLKAYGSYNWRKEFFKHNVNDYANTKFQEVGTVEVLKRLSGAELRNPEDTRKDFVLAFWGIGHKKICDAAKATGKAFVCEPGIGYSGSFMDFRVFESYAWMHTTYGEQKISRPSWYQVVIPNYFDPEEFHYSPIKGDYYLCLGRINTCKGVHIAIQAAKKLGIKLVLAGQGDIQKDLGITDIPENIIYYGYADVESRKKLMAYAKGFILLSAYIEPFGGAAVEAMMSGTPVICPDWGVFNETVPHGLVGYRVRTFDQICWAIKNIENINPANCRAWAMNNYSLAKVGKMYETYFIQLADVWEKGWYQEHPERTELDWLEKITPDEPPYLEFSDSETENFNLSEISKLNTILEEKKELMKNEEKLKQNIENLKQIFLKYNTDKFNDKPHCHTYHNRYGKLFFELKDKPIKIFEMGIGTVNPRIPSSMEGYQRLFNYQPGASHRAWSEYFTHPDTRICGGDIDEEICKDEMYIEFPKIKCKAVDQTNVQSVKECFSYFTTPKDENNFFNNDLFDVIIDDGLHTPEGTIGMLKGAWDYLKVGGIYVIEDLNFDLELRSKYIKPEFHEHCEIWCEPKNTGNIEDNYIFSIKKISNEPILIENFNVQKNETENLNVSKILNEKFNVSEISENIVLPEIPKIEKKENSKKIAIWCENRWAMGRIHNDLIKYMKKNSDIYDYQFDYLEWDKAENTNKLVKDWESYDLIISNSTIYNSKYKFFSHLYENPKFLSKVLCVSHCPLIDHKFYGEKLDGLSTEQIQNINLGHVSKQGVENLKLYYNLSEQGKNPRLSVHWLPCGVDLDNFKIKERVNFPLKNIGFIGKPDYDNNHDIKNVEAFKAIISRTNLNPIYIHSKSFTEYDKLYSDIDMLICTSSIEAGPLGIFEAAACGIPVISTKVGNVSELKNLITFDTIEQAVEIIEYLNVNPAVLQEYLCKVTDEVRNNWSSEILINKHWKPVIDNILDIKKSKSIAIWTENNWAFGRIHNDLIETFKILNYNDYNFNFFDWRDSSQNQKLKTDWDNYDLIITTPAIYKENSIFREFFKYKNFLSKVLCVGHFPIINHPYFNESINGLNEEQLSLAHIANVCKEGLVNYKKLYNTLSNLYWLPCGVNTNKFIPKLKQIYKLENIGFTGKPFKQDDSNHSENKRPQMFESIAEITNLNPIFIYDRPYTEYSKLYETPEIDLLICTAKYEGGPLGVFEAVSCGVPVISTKVGNTVELSSILTFETIEQAVEIIERFKDNPALMLDYITELQKEILEKFDWKVLVEKYWKPVIDNIIMKNI